ncbi:MAG: MmcQ/YjbR family DNA-binding protein [Deltaproteobacteria bacterium]|nr:MmcQ/YjbR family DNA-binding protein [bacterium]MCB9476541.1 MmcQ/YjbR family DNA-binding protein [Deltaproteobacteria bacterium]MCB9489467.1 MmcQ/YjbR family DNA-binding protein [Deltaproteobacteria bacterium]
MLRDHALSLPEAVEEFPWGQPAYKVRGKTFAFVHSDGDDLTVSLKLPESAEGVLMLPFAEPTGYNLGRSGWVTSRFVPGDDVPADMICAWMTESYRAMAPKKLSAALENEPARR